jgi:hypothetical protein
MSGTEPVDRREAWRQTKVGDPTAPSEPDDVRGFALNEDAACDEPPPSPVPEILPAPGAPFITGWPDPSPPVTDPATQAGWLRTQPEPPETIERP